MYNLIYLIMIYLYPCSFCSLKLFHTCTQIYIWILNVPMSNYGLLLWCYFVYAYTPYQGRFQGGAPRSGRTPLSFFAVWRPPDLCLAPPWAHLRANLALLITQKMNEEDCKDEISENKLLVSLLKVAGESKKTKVPDTRNSK